jgi:hypothetical protein
VNENPGVAPNVTVTFDVIVMNAMGAIPAPPIVWARRLTLCTAGVPPGCVASSVNISVAVLEARGKVMLPL